MTMFDQQKTFDTFAQIVIDTYNAIERIANDPRYVTAHKNQQIAEVRKASTQRITVALNEFEGSLRAELDRLPLPEPVRSSPSVADAPILLYLAQALPISWQDMTATALMASWQGVIDAGDLPSIRVYQDFAPSFLKSKPPYNVPGNEDVLQVEIEDLRENSRRALLSESARKDEDTCRELEAALKTVQQVAYSAKNEVLNSRVDGNGKILKAGQVVARDLIQSAEG